MNVGGLTASPPLQTTALSRTYSSAQSALIATAPRRVELDLERSLMGKPLALFCLFGLGMMTANGLTLAMGAKSVIDIMAASFTFVCMEKVNQIVWGAERRTFWHWCLMWFKWGLLYQFVLDGSFKLNGAIGVLPPLPPGLAGVSELLARVNPLTLYFS